VKEESAGQILHAFLGSAALASDKIYLQQ
jgi:hypothetical protein